jgi:hypothetical protein
VHVLGAPDSNEKVEQDERELAASCSISDDEQGMEEEEGVGERLSLPSHRYQHDVQASSRRARRAGRLNVCKYKLEYKLGTRLTGPDRFVSSPVLNFETGPKYDFTVQSGLDCDTV